jgi:hypothetical protein
MRYEDIGEAIITTLNNADLLKKENLKVFPVMAESAVTGNFIAYQRSNLDIIRAKQNILCYEATYNVVIVSPKSYKESLRVASLVKEAMKGITKLIPEVSFENHTEGYASGDFIQNLVYKFKV